ncbi:MAG: ATP-binding cassette domain-containing protein, partial [Mixta calida]|nr:ATP-binding cassette domain-containing protein [Mixta calida]
MLLSIEQAAIAGRLQPFSAQVDGGELIHLLGPNGAGKSTLLALIAGLLAGRGEVRIDGRPLATWSPKTLARRRAWLPQQQPQPGQMAVYHYLRQHADAQEPETLLPQLLRAFQLEDKLTRPLTWLSGGEWQRVRLAAVVLQITPQANPAGQLLLLDEPMNSLDVAQQSALDKILSALCQQGLAIVMSSHD